MAENEKPEKKRGLFPSYSLMDALKIAVSIKDNNNLQPYNRLNLAGTLNYSPSSSGFRLMIIASNGYGLTKGNYVAEKISLTPLGISIVAPKSEIEKKESLLKALFNVELFKKFFTNFNQGKITKKDYLINTLNQDYGVPLPICDKAYTMIMKNAQELGLIKKIKDADYIQLDGALPEPFLQDSSEEDIEEPEQIEEGKAIISQPQTELAQIFKPRVFISHSRNGKIVNQIKQILDFGQFEYVIAEETETTAIPISEKVFGLMKQCNCAIINFSVDGPGSENCEINQNVLIEIGAAFLKYDRKLILLVDKRIVKKLPSNLNGIYRCEYEGDELSFETAMKLQKALLEFRKE